MKCNQAARKGTSQPSVERSGEEPHVVHALTVKERNPTICFLEFGYIDIK